MSFTALCPTCGSKYRLLDRFLHRKVSCVDCRKPFRAENVHAETVEADQESPDPETRGWLVVCPACAHTELVVEEDRRELCSACGAALADPVTPSKKVRKKQ